MKFSRAFYMSSGASLALASVGANLNGAGPLVVVGVACVIIAMICDYNEV